MNPAPFVLIGGIIIVICMFASTTYVVYIDNGMVQQFCQENGFDYADRWNAECVRETETSTEFAKYDYDITQLAPFDFQPITNLRFEKPRKEVQP